MVPLVENSKWVEYQASSGKVFKLVSCPSGYRVVSQDGEFDLQRCEPCPSGEDCVAASCVNATCTPCKAGTYKDSAGVQACRACPKNTFNQDRGATAEAQCTSCAPGAVTAEEGATSSDACICAIRTYLAGTTTKSCKTCPLGKDTTSILEQTQKPRQLAPVLRVRHATHLYCESALPSCPAWVRR